MFILDIEDVPLMEVSNKLSLRSTFILQFLNSGLLVHSVSLDLAMDFIMDEFIEGWFGLLNVEELALSISSFCNESMLRYFEIGI